MPIKPDREYRRIDIANLETRQADDGQMIVEGYATTFEQPYELFSDDETTVMEEIDKSAFDGCDMEDVIMQYDHQGRVFARTRNKTLTVTPNEHGLFIRAYLGGTEIGRQLYEEIKGGYTDRMSFGFVVDADERQNEVEPETNRAIIRRRITRMKKIFDVSAVSIPANDYTSLSCRSFCDGLIAEAAKEHRAYEERQRKIKQIKILTEVLKHDH